MEKEDLFKICCFFVIDFYHIHSSCCWIVRERLYEELIHLVEIEVFYEFSVKMAKRLINDRGNSDAAESNW